MLEENLGFTEVSLCCNDKLCPADGNILPTYCNRKILKLVNGGIKR